VLAGAAEGDADRMVLERLVAEAGASLDEVHGGKGKAALRASIRGYNNDARFRPWVVSLAQGSRRKGIREDMVPRPGSGRSVGYLYNSRLYEFIAKFWRADKASERSERLRRCRAGIAQLVAER
jgi:hypothetical protein